MPKKSMLSPEQRMQLVLRLLSKEEPAAQIARRAGVGVSNKQVYRVMKAAGLLQTFE